MCPASTTGSAPGHAAPMRTAAERGLGVRTVPPGDGLRLLEGTGSHALEEIGVVEAGARTGLRSRVQRAGRDRR